MKDLLRTLLTPADDGRAFTDAVLLRASGALHRRRHAEPASEPVWSLLERWARPWVVAALLLLAVAAVVPTWAPAAPAAIPTVDSALASVMPAEVAAATAVMKE